MASKATRYLSLALFLLTAAFAWGGQVIVTAPSGESVRVEVAPNQPAEVTLKDGTKLIGVDLSWYTAAKPGDGPISDDDRKEIEQILTVPSFYNKQRILQLSGDNQHATALVELVRDSDFHAGGKDIIWRMELWYFEFENGGWAKVSQQNKLLDRQRFPGRDAYARYVQSRRWVPKLGKIPGSTKQVGLTDQDLIRAMAVTE